MKSHKRVLLTASLAAALALGVMLLPLVLVNAQAPTTDQPAAAGAAGRGGRGANRGGGAPAGGQAAGGRGGRGGVGTTPPPTSPVTGNAIPGKKLYFDYGCYACHGYNGETGRAFVGNWGNLQ